MGYHFEALAVESIPHTASCMSSWHIRDEVAILLETSKGTISLLGRGPTSSSSVLPPVTLSPLLSIPQPLVCPRPPPGLSSVPPCLPRPLLLPERSPGMSGAFVFYLTYGACHLEVRSRRSSVSGPPMVPCPCGTRSPFSGQQRPSSVAHTQHHFLPPRTASSVCLWATQQDLEPQTGGVTQRKETDQLQERHWLCRAPCKASSLGPGSRSILGTGAWRLPQVSECKAAGPVGCAPEHQQHLWTPGPAQPETYARMPLLQQICGCLPSPPGHMGPGKADVEAALPLLHHEAAGTHSTAPHYLQPRRGIGAEAGGRAGPAEPVLTVLSEPDSVWQGAGREGQWPAASGPGQGLLGEDTGEADTPGQEGSK
ncbi:apolipoprotein A-II isoform X2 [Artibeus jamaicensis]|uniref:apolipoprotein A-II isoform X2 n=1 Tax=Artibeus jamaicensis TaxID=9417 RepID=UPI00235AE385|nr:apolipoprotein A-II isoform X2 [Artibeus jamaicensis]